LPLGFEAGEDIAKGNVYADETGKLISREELNKRLKTGGTRRVVRVVARYRLPGDPIEMELRQTVVNVPVIGAMDNEELGRVAHTAVRNVHDAIRRREGGAETK